ncbi:MAG: DUF1549 domain-containing protein, partial [Bryobacteraceae bacterium]
MPRIGALRAVSATIALACVLPAETRWSFPNQITPILTFGGCNQTACHGSPFGKNGFKLSLFGYQPEDDYAAIRKRVNTKDPALSLIVLKPTMSVAHAGGPRFKKDSHEYKTLLAWIEAGALLGDKDAPVITKLEVAPGYRVLQSISEKQQLTVTAVYSDGVREDVTPRAVYTSNDDSILKIDRAGLATPAGGNGDAALMVRYGGHFAARVLGATMLPEPRRFPAAPENVIDREVYAKLRDLRIVPSGLCTDAEFIRRLYLDVIGVLPSPAEVRIFLSSKSPDRRALLVEQVLARPEYADLQTLMWADR